MNAQGQLRDVVHGICFVTHPAFIGEARRQWERRTTNAIMDYIVLPALPRDALVEWQVWAHTHNDRFDCKPPQIHLYLITWMISNDLESRSPMCFTLNRFKTCFKTAQSVTDNIYTYIYTILTSLCDLCRRGNRLLGQRLHHLDTSSLELWEQLCGYRLLCRHRTGLIHHTADTAKRGCAEQSLPFGTVSERRESWWDSHLYCQSFAQGLPACQAAAAAATAAAVAAWWRCRADNTQHCHQHRYNAIARRRRWSTASGSTSNCNICWQPYITCDTPEAVLSG